MQLGHKLSVNEILELNVGDVIHEVDMGFRMSVEITSKPVLNGDKLTWVAKTLPSKYTKSDHVVDYLITKGA